MKPRTFAGPWPYSSSIARRGSRVACLKCWLRSCSWTVARSCRSDRVGFSSTQEGALELHLNQWHLAHMAYELEGGGSEVGVRPLGSKVSGLTPSWHTARPRSPSALRCLSRQLFRGRGRRRGTPRGCMRRSPRGSGGSHGSSSRTAARRLDGAALGSSHPQPLAPCARRRRISAPVAPAAGRPSGERCTAWRRPR